MARRNFYLTTAFFMLMSSSFAFAEYKDAPASPHTLTPAERLSLARQFVERISAGFKNAGKTQDELNADFSNVPDGEELLFRIQLDRTLYLDSTVLTRVHNGGLTISLRDLLGALQFPIAYDVKTQNASGWYIRENRPFDLNGKSRKVTTAQGSFDFSKDVMVGDDDIYVPLEEVSSWFQFDLKPRLKELDLFLKSDTPLPIQEKLLRKQRQDADFASLAPQLPLSDPPQKMTSVPFVDVANTTEYRKTGDGLPATLTQKASVQTAGDFAKGTLTSQSQWDREEKLTNLRVNYKKEHINPDLLGPLKARRYELGDINPSTIPLIRNSDLGVGARITNKDPQRAYLSPRTEISGTAFPGWDVELYRDSQYVAFQSVDDNGFYRFKDVDLNTTDNRFRVVFYGPQGQIREEELFVPVDPKRLADAGMAYDVSLTRQNTQAYRKAKVADSDSGAPSLRATIEQPIGAESALSAGLVTHQDNAKQNATFVSGLSTSLLGSLVNIDGAIDTKSEMAAELAVRRKIGRSEFRNETKWNTDNYGVVEPDTNLLNSGFNFFTSSSTGGNGNEVFSNELGMNGPLDLKLGKSSRYDLSLRYGLNSEGNQTTEGTTGFSTLLKPVAFNQQFRYTKSDNLTEDKASSLTTLSGSIGKNRVRFGAEYQIMPENKLDRLVATAQRSFTPKLQGLVGVQHKLDPNFTEGSAQVTWDAGYVQISPGVTYNTNKDLTATLNTRFGLARDPATGSIKSFDQTIVNNGGVSALVFLDKDGDNIFNGKDEAIEGAIISAPQNGGRETTDKDGRVFFKSMSALRVTDVLLDEDTLPDPYWISGFKGLSIIPREGHVVELNFPVHIAGEMDGTIYKRRADRDPIPARSLRVGLYDPTGKNVQSVMSESDGYYTFSKIPPGTYYLNIDDSSLGDSLARPLPQKIQIGFEGTTIYGNKVYLQEGRPDVPLSILATDKIFGEKNDAYKGRKFAMNLGSYKSRLAMGIAWFKVRMFNKDILNYADLVSAPSNTIPDDGSDKYVLRLSFKGSDLNDAYKKCEWLVKAGNSCALEILPGGLDDTKLAAK